MAATRRQIRYLTAEELTRLRRHAEARALQARERGRGEDVSVVSWFSPGSGGHSPGTGSGAW